MVDFNQEDLLNELSQIFRGNIVPETVGGVVDPAVIHGQVMEIARTVFLLNPGAIFYLALLVKNRVGALVSREISLVEDMLIALDDLEGGTQRNDGGIIGNIGPTDLANAETALLALEAAYGRNGSVAGRPELERFQRIMDRLAGRTRQNVVNLLGNYALPRGEARDILSNNLSSLQTAHPSVLSISENIRSIVSNYNDLDIPSQVSQTALVNIRLTLAQLKETIEDSSDEELITNSRLILLRTLASKVVVALLEQFNVLNLGDARLTSDNTGTAAVADAGDGPFLAQAAGEGVAAEVFTAPGPWLLDSLSSTTLSFRIDGGAVQTFDLSVIEGPGLHSRNSAPFSDSQLYPTWPGPGAPTDPPPPPEEEYLPKANFHIILDTNTYEFTSQEWGYVDSTDTFFGPTAGPNPPAPDNNPPPANLIDSALTADSPRVYPSPSGIIGGLIGTPGDLISDYWNTVRMQPPVKLGFKHLGCIIYFSLIVVPDSSGYGAAQKGAGFGGWNCDGQDNLEDAGEFGNILDRRWNYILRPRTVWELTPLSSVTLVHVAGNQYTVTGSPADEDWVGFYVRVGATPATWERYEIIEVTPGGGSVIVDTRTDAPGSAAGTWTVFGQRGDYTQLTFFPDLLADTDDVADVTGSSRGPHSVPNTCKITLSPAVKTANVPVTQGTTIANVVGNLQNPAVADIDYPDNKYQAAAYHCIFKEQTGFTGKLTVQNRSRFLPDEMQITDTFQKTQMFLPAQNPAGTRLEVFPGPVEVETVEESGHEVFGFDIAQRVDPSLDPFLSVEELESVISESVDSSTTLVEIVETDVFAGVMDTIDGTFTTQDTTANFVTLGVGLGYLLELLDGDASGIYIILSATGSKLTLQRNTEILPSTGFIAREENLSYRIFRRQLRIASKNAGAGSSVEITAAPTEFSLPTTIQYGTTPSIEAVNSGGENLDLSGLEEGDSSNGLVVAGVSSDGTQAEIEGGVSSDTVGLTFSFESSSSNRLQTMINGLTSVLDSRNNLARNGFNENLDKLDAALSSLVTPGQTFQADINRARQLLADLLSSLTNDPRRSELYSAVIPVKSVTLEQTLQAYTATRVRPLDVLVSALEDHGFDRALALLMTGDLDGFFSTTEETASFGGALLSAAKTVAADVPQSGVVQQAVDDELNRSTSTLDEFDPDVEFPDTEGERQDLL